MREKNPRSNIHCILHNYRSQSVVLDGLSSEPIPVTSGVPQELVLGPLLFIAYINDLPQNLTSKVRLFADDTAVYLTLNSVEDSETLQNDLQLLEKWEEDWDMEFNPSKCQVVHVTRLQNPFPSQYFLHNTLLQAVTSAKYLGVDISEDLSWGTHIDRVTKKANQTLGFLRRNIKVKSEKLKSTAYKTLVLPQLEYCSEVWSPHTTDHIEQLEAVQRRAARWVKSDYGRKSSVIDMLQSLGWRRLDQRRTDSRLIMLYKIKDEMVAIPIDGNLSRNIRQSRHSHPLAYKLITATTDYYKYSFFPRSIFHWNRLPAHIPSLPTMERFSAAVGCIEHACP